MTTDLPLAESIGTTQNIDKNSLTYESGLWSYWMGLLYDEESHKYTHTIKQGETVSIYNAGSVEVHPFEQELKIEVSNVYRSRKHFELNNETNGSTFRVKESVSSSDKIVYDGANIRINGLEELRRTNRKYITLETGWNVISIDGADSAEVSIDFRFYYL